MRSTRRLGRLGAGVLAIAAGLALVPAIAGATTEPSDTGDVTAAEAFDPAAAGDITLEVWTAEYGTRLELVEQRIEEFTTAYPNIQVNLTVRDFAAYPAQIRLALTSDDAPDVAIGNIGWSLDGPLIQAGLLQELTPWVELYGWDERYAEVAQQQLRFAADGSQFGVGPIFGIPYAADVIGWFYNKEKLAALGLEPPATFDELEADFAAALDAGETPMVVGAKDQWPALHVFFTINNNLATTEQVTGIVFGDPAVSWNDEEFVASAEKLAEWGEAGFFQEGFNGLASTDANVKFGDGEGVFYPAGSWNVAEFAETMGDNVGFFLTPPNTEGEARRATGSFGYGWHITSATEHADASAFLIDFLTNEDAAREFFAVGDIAPLNVTDPELSPVPVSQDVYNVWTEVLANDTLLPYLDFSDPKAGEIIYPNIQEILSGDTDPADGLARIEESRQEFLASLTG